LFIIQIKKIFLHDAKTRTKFSGGFCNLTKSCRKKIQAFVRLQKHKSNLQEVFASCKKLLQKISGICKITKAQIKFAGGLCIMQKAAAKNFRRL
jgi:hypothetical protein